MIVVLNVCYFLILDLTFFIDQVFSGITSPMTTSMYSDVQGPSYTTDMRILMENMQALNVNGRQDEPTLINTAALKEKRTTFYDSCSTWFSFKCIPISDE